jgi:RNA polymerase sigma factor (sigma-70 family)
MDVESISIWLDEVKRGNDEAARRLWERYFPLLVRLARKRLAGVPRRMEDEEDVALSALDSFCRAADRGRFPHVNDRQSLWRLLCRITHRKAVDLVRRSRTKLGDAKVCGESRLTGGAAALKQPMATAIDFAAMLSDEVHGLLEMLPEEELKTIAIAKMEGYTNQEIAARLGWAERTIERRLKYIRAIWKRGLSPAEGQTPRKRHRDG